MRLITFEKDSKTMIGVLDRNGSFVADIGSLGLTGAYRDMNSLIRDCVPGDFEILAAYAKAEGVCGDGVYNYEQIGQLPPIPRPAHDIICLGMNYSAHIEEFGGKKPGVPVFFSKRAAVCSGHGDVICGHLDVDDQLDYEVELAVVIGKECSKIEEKDVEEFIFGYTVFNDFSARQLQKIHKQWYLGKSSDSFTAMGPWIVTKDEIPLGTELDLCSRVNGEVRQQSNTRMMMFGIAEVIALLSRTITLEPGDIIATGTPSGVGLGFDPPRYLKRGDKVECEVQGVGVLKNIIG